ncbi:calcium-binding protein [Azospirillum sp. SYSU D00513]|uniref:calcium-binding protein n=1 Tax=Azospirillum sp. SYSU D00513 TaxID=2812561 RepID=UPI001A97170C|nr:calcium-binding protein [Azospirillum sp. SYSU D00513]
MAIVTYGTGGNNQIWRHDGSDIVYGYGGNDTLDGGNGADTVDGGDGNDVLYAGNDADPDRLVGGTGNDTYWVNGPEDVLVEQAGAGRDAVIAKFSWTLGANFEDLTLQEAGASANGSGTGNGLNNVIAGNSGNNLLSGGGGNDTLRGSGGNDTLDGGAGLDDLYGGDGQDLLLSNGDGNRMWGGAGADVFSLTTRAKDGTPTWSTDAASDFELGVDKIALAAGWTYKGVGTPTHGQSAWLTFENGEDQVRLLMPQHPDVLTAWIARNGANALFTSPPPGGSGPATVTNGTAGNDAIWRHDGSDIVYGFGGNDTLDGGNGADTVDGGDGNDVLFAGNDADPDRLAGGTGNDTYWVNGPEDVLVEQAGAGRDAVIAKFSWTLGANFEDLTLQEAGASANGSATGNGLDNVIAGNSGNNLVSGGDGADTLTGGGGNDTLLGGGSYDNLSGGDGQDLLLSNGDGNLMRGGAGADIFLLSTRAMDGTPGWTMDGIADFELGVDKVAVADDWTYLGIGVPGHGQSAWLTFDNGEDEVRISLPQHPDDLNAWIARNGVESLFTTAPGGDWIGV